jgi:hypothetical protein
MPEQDVSTKSTQVTRIVRAVGAASIALGLGTLAACSEADPVELPAGGQGAEISSTVTAATWTDGPWPFTIEKGELTCIGPEDDPGVFIVTDAGEMFALNPAAIRMAGEVGAMADLDPIWRWRDPEFPTAKVNVSPMILYALELC